MQLKVQEELYTIAKQVAHDICSPLASLEMIKYMSSDKLSEQESKMLELTITSIKEISNRLIEKYIGIQHAEAGKEISVIDDRTEDKYIAPYLVLQFVVDDKRYRFGIAVCSWG